VRKIKFVSIIMVVVIAGLGGLSSYNARRFHLEKQTRFMMDTYVTINAVGPKQAVLVAINSAFERMQELSVKLNSRDPQSPIYIFNHQGLAISDPEIIELIRVALQVSRESDGAFDITVAPLVELWGFSEKNYRSPSDQEIQDCLKNVGYQHLVLENGKVEKDNPGIRIDLGGIAKGYILSQAAEVLKAQGITSAIVDAGGDVYALGKKGKRLWRVGVRNPRENDILGYLEVEDLAVISSGDYERFFIKEERRYHHIFNPKTGYSTEGVIGVTLIYPDPVLAQAWTKIPFVLGPQKGLEMLEKIPGMEAIIITSSVEIFYPSGLKQIFREF
jgi:thiamine biosynthesis lipoprotein